jgi:pimeloyl-ACP methyl ester carboxylesterase
MRARRPDREGHVESGGIRIFWEEHGTGDRAVLFLPAWQLLDHRVWKMQLPYFSRFFRTLVFDPPGNGRSDRPATGYGHEQLADHARAVMDAASV